MTFFVSVDTAKNTVLASGIGLKKASEASVCHLVGCIVKLDTIFDLRILLADIGFKGNLLSLHFSEVKTDGRDLDRIISVFSAEVV
jgi:hypothetical protein